MSDKMKTICRLCLKTITDNSTKIDEDTKEMVDILLKLNLSVSKEPVICKDCFEKVKIYFEFKSSFVSTENYKFGFSADNVDTKMDLKQVHGEIDSVMAKVHTVCRLCTKSVRTMECMSLQTLKEITLLSEDVFIKYLPKMNLSTTEEPLICFGCKMTLEGYFTFLKNCWDVEEDINRYLKLEEKNDTEQIELSDVQQFTNVLHSNMEGYNQVYIKTEGNLENVEAENKKLVTVKKEMVIKEEDVEEDAKYDQPVRVLFGEDSSEKALNKCDVCASETENKGCIHCPMQVHEDPSQVPPDKHKQLLLRTKYKNNARRRRLPNKDASPTALFKCESCTFVSKYKKSLKDHIKLHADPSKVTTYKCDACVFKTRNKKSLRKHMLVHVDLSQITTYKCELCPFETKFKYSLQRHSLVHKGPTQIELYKCEECPFETRYKESLQSHMLCHEDPNMISFRCDVCDYETKFKHNLKKHKVFHEDSQITIYKCDKCDFETKYKNSLQAHMLIHVDPSRRAIYKCETCPFETKYKHSIRNHLLLHQDPSQVTIHKCEVCAFETKHKRNLGSHMLIHKNASEVEAYMCKLCPYSTKFKYVFRRHMKTHKKQPQ